MVRTLTQIQGDYGLNQDATGDPFAQQEQVIADTAKQTVKEIQSAAKANTVAKGSAYSSFDRGQEMKQESDVLSNLYTSFAQNRLNNVNADLALQRNLVSQGASSDITTEQNLQNLQNQKDLLGEQYKYNEMSAEGAYSRNVSMLQEQTNAQKELTSLGFDNQQKLMDKQASLEQEAKTADVVRQKEIMQEQAKLNELSAQAGYTRQVGFLGEQTAATKDINAFNSQTQQQLMALQQSFNTDTMARQFGYQSQALQQNATLSEIAAQNQQSRDLAKMDAQTENQLSLLASSTDAEIAKLNEQFKLGEISSDNALDRQRSLIQSNTTEQLKLINEQWKNNQIDATTAFQRQSALLDQNFQYEKQKIQTAFDNGEISANNNLTRQQSLIDYQSAQTLNLFKEQEAYKRSNMSETLRIQYDTYEKPLLEEKMRLEAQNAKTQLENTFWANMAVQGVSFLTGVAGAGAISKSIGGIEI